MWPEILSGNVAPMLYPLLCASFCDKKRNVAHSHSFLLQTKHKTADKHWSNVSKIASSPFLFSRQGALTAQRDWSEDPVFSRSAISRDLSTIQKGTACSLNVS